jgi:hypothetical protein
MSPNFSVFFLLTFYFLDLGNVDGGLGTKMSVST